MITHIVNIDVYVEGPDTDDPAYTFMLIQEALDDAGYGETYCVAVDVQDSEEA